MLQSKQGVDSLKMTAAEMNADKHESKRDAMERIISLLGEPYYRDEFTALYHGDCTDMLNNIPANSIDLTVTSPPYNIGKEYEDILNIDTYLNWCEQWVQLIHSATSSDGSFWLNLGYISIPGSAKAIPISYLLWPRIPFFLIQEIVWNYSAGVAGRRFYSPRNEKFLWYVADEDNYTFNLDAVRDPNVKYPNQKKNGKLKVNPLGKNPSDVWQIAKVTSGSGRSSTERTAHPAQFPVQLIDRIVKASSNEFDIVLDPFMGSGSTAEACRRNNRFSIGFEINAQYLDIQKRRLAEIDKELRSKHYRTQEGLFD